MDDMSYIDLCHGSHRLGRGIMSAGTCWTSQLQDHVKTCPSWADPIDKRQTRPQRTEIIKHLPRLNHINVNSSRNHHHQHSGPRLQSTTSPPLCHKTAAVSSGHEAGLYGPNWSLNQLYSVLHSSTFFFFQYCRELGACVIECASATSVCL